MPSQVAEPLVNELISICHFTKKSPPDKPSRRVISREGGSLAIETFADNRRFDDLVHRLWRLYPDLAESLQFKVFFEALISLLILLKQDNSIRPGKALIATFGPLEDLPKGLHRVVREIAGAVLKSGPPRILGAVTIYNPALHEDPLWNSTTFLSESRNIPKRNALLAEINVVARDYETAVARADTQFRLFESCVSLLVGRDENRQIAIVRNSPAWIQEHFVQSPTVERKSSSWRGNIIPVDLNNDDIFQAPFARALFKISSAPSCNWDYQIQRAVDWLGQSYSDPFAASAFVKACIALEAFFTGIEQAPISASIVAKIAESCAFIVAQSADDRIYIERTVKDLYGTRSAIMHSGHSGIYDLELKRLLDICRGLLIRFTLEPAYKDVKTRSDLQGVLQGLKYGS